MDQGSQEPSPGRWRLVVGVCTLSNFADGFDIMAAAFVGPAVAREFGLSPASLGLLFGAGLAGVALGSLLIAPLADRAGRRTVALGCMAVMALGMLLSAMASGPDMLIGLRLLTGLGIGGMLATLNTVVAETAPPHRRNLALSLLSIGYPLGSMVGGLIAIGLIGRFGWQSLFLVGGCGTAAIFLLQLFLLPESAQTASAGSRAGASVFSGANRGNLAAVSAAFFLNMLCFFFILNWTPKLIEELGLPASTGITATVVLNLTGLIGGLAYGLLADRYGWRRVARPTFALFGLLTALFGFVPASPLLLFLAAGAIGVAMAAAMTSLYAAAAIAFPERVRASGTGLAIGIGRVGGTLGPILAGFALSGGVGHGPLYLIFAAFPLLVILSLRRVREPGELPAKRPFKLAQEES